MIALWLALVFEAPFPLAPGTWWEYRETYTERLGELDSSTQAVTRFVVRGRPDRLFLHQDGGADPASGPIESGPGWLRLGGWTGEDPLPLPLEPGRAYEEEGGRGWTVELEEEVATPAGRFLSLRCALRTRENASVLWIAPGVGVVRETHGTPGRRPEIERELLRWSGGSTPPPVSPGASASRRAAPRRGR